VDEFRIRYDRGRIARTIAQSKMMTDGGMPWMQGELYGGGNNDSSTDQVDK